MHDATGGPWIKLRASLPDSPQAVVLARLLGDDPDFRAWLGGQALPPPALRALAVGLLARLWCAAREHGRPDGEDLVIPLLALDDLDALGGAPGLGRALAAVGWAAGEPGGGVRLPRFAEHNAPRAPAERMRDSRARRANPAAVAPRCAGVAPALRDVAPTETETEKEKEKKNPPLPPGGEKGAGLPDAIDTPEVREAWSAWEAHSGRISPQARARQLDALAAMGPARAAAALGWSVRQNYRGIVEPPPARASPPGACSRERFRAILRGEEACR